MKSIEEFIKERIIIEYNDSLNVLGVCERSIRKTIEFAQKWYEVGIDEMPDVDDRREYICKNSEGEYILRMGCKIKQWTYPYIHAGHITHFRPIELK